jgi:hypothetical protein
MFNDEKNAEAYFHMTPSFYKSFGCDFSAKNISMAEIDQFNEFY